MEEVLACGNPPREAKMVECLRQCDRRKVLGEDRLLRECDKGVQPH